MRRNLNDVVGVMILICFAFIGGSGNAQVWYAFPCSLPNNDRNSADFGTARDGLLNGIVMGGSIVTRSRSDVVTGVEIGRMFEIGDMCVSTDVTLWRGQINPPAPYADQHGQRLYCPILLVGHEGRVALGYLKYRVLCGIPALGNQSSLSGLDYSVSRIGVEKGPDGALFTQDDVVRRSGSGTNLVDAIAFIGARIGALVNDNSHLTNVWQALGAEGTFAEFEYEYSAPGQRTSTKSFRVSIERSRNRHWSIEPFVGPRGVLFSVVGPAGMPQAEMLFARRVVGPWTAAGVAKEGASVFLPFIGDNDMGFCKLR